MDRAALDIRPTYNVTQLVLGRGAWLRLPRPSAPFPLFLFSKAKEPSSSLILKLSTVALNLETYGQQRVQIQRQSTGIYSLV